MDDTIIIIMAGGLGKRMQSDLPKVLHKINKEPMLVKIIKEARLINPNKILIVVGKYYQKIKSVLEEYISITDIQFVFQEEPLGTGHAIQCCIPILKEHLHSNVLILSGDVPLLKSETMQNILFPFRNALITTTVLENPHGYGRIIEHNGIFEQIIEEKDCNEQDKTIQKVNCGLYTFKCEYLINFLPKLTCNNSQNEYYLTELLSILTNDKIVIDMFNIPLEQQYQIIGVNTKEQLDVLDKLDNKFNK